MVKHFFTNSFGILFSRVFGFIRDLLMASALGASIYMDFFVIAFKIPNLLRRIFAEGAFSQVFIPAFTSSKHKFTFAIYIFLVFFSILCLISSLVYIFSYDFTSLIAFGLDQKYIKELHHIVAINFFYIIFVFIFTFISAILHYKHHFFTTSISTSFLNISIIIAILIPNTDKLDLLYNISFAVLIGGFLQVLAHIVAIYVLKLEKAFLYSFYYIKEKYKIVQKDIKEFKEKLFPAILGASSYQLASFLDIFLATFLASSSISYLYFANRVFQFPFALFTIALSISIFPHLAKLIKKQNLKQAFTIFKQAFYFILLLLASATIVGIMFSEQIMTLLFERGQWSHQDSIKSSQVLIAYLIGLLPFGLAKIFSLWLFSKKQQKQTALIAIIAITSNAILSLLLISQYKVFGLAIASSISGFIQLILSIYYFGFRDFVKYVLDIRYILSLIVILFFVFIVSFGVFNSI